MVGEIDLVRAGGRPKHVAVLLTALVILYPLVPQGGLRQTCYSLLGAASVAMGLWGASAVRTAARRGWIILLAGFGTMVLGDAAFSLEQLVFHVDFYPAPSDAVYLTAYVLLVVGMLRLVTGRTERDLVPLLDSAIVAVGFAIVVVTFFITPQAGDSDLNLAGKAVASAYPAADVLLMAALARLCTSASARSTACRLLLLSLGATLAADIGWNILALTDPQENTPVWMDLLWLAGYVCAGTAACTYSAASLSGRDPEKEVTSAGRLSPVVAAACLLPGLTLFVDGLTGEHVAWLPISVGSLALAALALLRLRLVLRAVAAQAAQLSVLGAAAAVPDESADEPWEIELGRRSGMGRD